LNCLDNSMQKVRIKKENAPALSDRADALPLNHFKASYGSIFHAVGIIAQIRQERDNRTSPKPAQA
ncbi:MAG: hypothetical protein OIF54_17205, partial [Cohaesibacter sp.]|nr:hypothetical protein [Cohaesibacter sp.]